MAQIIVVEDELAHAELINRAFQGRQDHFEVTIVRSLAEARRHLDEATCDLLITDLVLPDGRGTELIPTDDARSSFPVVVMTSHGDEKVAVEAIKAGALDYVVKSAETLRTMPHVAERALREWHQRRELEQTQKQLRQAQKMEAIGNLSSGIAHDFNNLLMGITGCTDVALSKLDADSPARRYIEEIKKAALRGSSLTRQLLAFSRKRESVSRVVDLDAVVEEANNLLRPLVSEDIDVALALSDEPLYVCCDPGQIEQMLVNLVVNARDAMPDGGSLTVSTHAAELDDEQARTLGELEAGRYVMLSVEDTGTGMDSKTLQHIFEPFFTTKDVGHGTGLGLSTIYGIVKQRGGEIVVDSEVGRGTVFEVYLPRTDQVPQEAVEAPQADLKGNGETVLVVEDESLVRLTERALLSEVHHVLRTDASRPDAHQPEAALTPSENRLLLVEDHATARWTIRELLGDEGYQVFEAANGAGAIEIIEEHGDTIDLVIADVQLPDIAGPALAERMRRTLPTLGVVFTSGRSEDDPAIRKALQADHTTFVGKPVDFDTLLAVIEQMLVG